MMMKVVIGIDLGTQGVRVLAVNKHGLLVANTAESMPRQSTKRERGLHEQDPQAWWQITSQCLKQVVHDLPKKTQIDGISIDSTSGTLVVVGQDGEALHPAIMYNDNRSASYVSEVSRAGKTLEEKLGYSFKSSFALPKMVWFTREKPNLLVEPFHFLSETDYIIGKLSGSYLHSDFSNMLKFGYDLIDMAWPAFIENDLGIPFENLPRVVPPGTSITTVSENASLITGIPTGVPIIAGATDGTAAQLSSGAVEIGSWNSALGTTLVLKGITKELLKDPQQRIYCHRHPETGWMPGGASNTGADWISEEFPDVDPEIFNEKAREHIPTSIIRYPLQQPGERFPFSSDQARGFIVGSPSNEIERYAAGLEGVAFLEKLAYEIMSEVGAPITDVIHITGGGARSSLWSEIRASVLGKSLLKPKIGQAGLGAAILAAKGVWFDQLIDAVKAMVQIDMVTPPNPDWHSHYQEKYQQFKEELINRGYLIVNE
jgi:xylulokinase